MPIDWKNLDPLPLKRRDGSDRERLAHASLEKKKAHHNGRNHFHAWQKRQAAKAKAIAHKKTLRQKQGTRSRFLSATRAYWRGETDEHP